ncbi:pyridoxamine 5'-phosphate oxidase family protein [Methanolobus bombayensis]|uniref:pyridoxamine 5'-phosphate oxidase family protein n=1 Tax=Methanolobus bombayensis TaxID=38023 RepID=UPI001FD7FC9C|nr:pyridoxamine 5'-phosphate oxidase family protein [Methanolobus bombayensis]MBP1910201.1 putative pyridoxamine 5'-phosphate oxidase family protein [Methanolobus bombayensis]
MVEMSPKGIIEYLLNNEKLAVLATEKEGQPYTNLIAFATTEDFKKLIFVTPRFTRKYSNILSSHNASIMIDNRSNELSDFKATKVINAMGTIKEVDKDPILSEIYLSKNKHLHDFFYAPSSALMMMYIEKYIIATNFQNVVEINIDV